MINQDVQPISHGQDRRSKVFPGCVQGTAQPAHRLYTTTMFDWAQRYATGSEAGLVSRKPDRSYLSGRTLTLPQEWELRTIWPRKHPRYGACCLRFMQFPVSSPEQVKFYFQYDSVACTEQSF